MDNPNDDDDLCSTIDALAGAIGPNVSTQQLREAAVELLVAVSWDGEELQI